MFLFPLLPNSKLPPRGVSWKTLLSSDRAQHKRWLSEGSNVGYPTGAANGVVVIDYDDKTTARMFYQRVKGEISTMVETRKGVHFFFRLNGFEVRNSQKTDAFPYDVRGEGGYVVYPDSMVEGWRYKFVKGHGPVPAMCLPPIRAEWIPPPAKKMEPIREDDPVFRLYRARRWLAKVPGAVEGNGGDAKTYSTCCALVQRFGLSEGEALSLLLEWNDSCSPPWSLRELTRKLRSAINGKPN